MADDVTRLLKDWSDGDEDALSELMERIHGELRRLAASYLRRERSDHTLQSSALVNEAFLRLVDQKRVRWRNRAHFYGIAASMMRRVLVNHALRRRCDKRGGGAEHLPFDEAVLLSEDRLAGCLAVDEALVSLATIHPQQARAVEMRYFGGLTREEIAEVLDVSVPTVTRRLRVARAWLYRYFNDGDEGGS